MGRPHPRTPRTEGIAMELKPCPLCGHSAYTECGLIETFVGMAEVWRVSCNRVGCPAKTLLFDTLKEAIDAWNAKAKREPK